MEMYSRCRECEPKLARSSAQNLGQAERSTDSGSQTVDQRFSNRSSLCLLIKLSLTNGNTGLIGHGFGKRYVRFSPLSQSLRSGKGKRGRHFVADSYGYIHDRTNISLGQNAFIHIRDTRIVGSIVKDQDAMIVERLN